MDLKSHENEGQSIFAGPMVVTFFLLTTRCNPTRQANANYNFTMDGMALRALQWSSNILSEAGSFNGKAANGTWTTTHVLGDVVAPLEEH